ncbi:MAG: 2-oxoacid:acceptor oxidoreductase family protein [Candidatus Falkowbacteria bacterium]
MKKQILITGTGGQGIKTIGDILAKAAARQGLYPADYSIYTPQARGGDIVSSLVISDRPLTYPLVETADVALILSDPLPAELLFPVINGREYPKLSPRTIVVYEDRPGNLPRICKKEREIKGLVTEPFSNLVVLGALQKLVPQIKSDCLWEIIKENFKKTSLEETKRQYEQGQNLI